MNENNANSIPAVQPVSPVAPTAPATPVAPVTPVAPATPVAPIEQAAPGAPASPVTPVMPAVPGAPQSPVPPVMQQPMNSVPPKAGGNNKMIIAIVIAVVVIAVAVVVVLLVSNKKEDNNGGGCKGDKCDVSTSNSGSNSDSNTGSNSSGGSVTPVANTFNVKVGNVSYKVPVDYSTAVDGEWLLITDDENNPTWVAQVEMIPGSFSSLSSHSDEELRAQIEGSGATNVTLTRQAVNGNQYLMFSYNMQGMNLVDAYREKDTVTAARVVIRTANNTYGTSYVDIIDKIITDATIGDDGYSMEVDVQGIPSLIQ